MAQFLGDIAGMLEIFAIAAGLVLLHLASKEAPAKLLNAAGVVLIAGGVVSGLCTLMFWFQYYNAGDFDRAASWHTPAAMTESMPDHHATPAAAEVKGARK